eukprot:m.112473 g.112473  ORF g.112473 m.112473 type:complete len:406 (+) comp16183_c0_seq4:168-1385(+)
MSNQHRSGKRQRREAGVAHQRQRQRVQGWGSDSEPESAAGTSCGENDGNHGLARLVFWEDRGFGLVCRRPLAAGTVVLDEERPILTAVPLGECVTPATLAVQRAASSLDVDPDELVAVLSVFALQPKERRLFFSLGGPDELLPLARRLDGRAAEQCVKALFAELCRGAASEPGTWQWGARQLHDELGTAHETRDGVARTATVALAAQLLAANGREDAQGNTVVYLKASRANHSCNPNCTQDQGRLRFVAGVVPAGEELTVSYLTDLELTMPRTVRQALLRHGWGFSCRCSRCAAPFDDALVFKSRCQCPGGRAFATSSHRLTARIKCQGCNEVRLKLAHGSSKALNGQQSCVAATRQHTSTHYCHPRTCSSTVVPLLSDVGRNTSGDFQYIGIFENTRPSVNNER